MKLAQINLQVSQGNTAAVAVAAPAAGEEEAPDTFELLYQSGRLFSDFNVAGHRKQEVWHRKSRINSQREREFLKREPSRLVVSQVL